MSFSFDLFPWEVKILGEESQILAKLGHFANEKVFLVCPECPAFRCEFERWIFREATMIRSKCNIL